MTEILITTSQFLSSEQKEFLELKTSKSPIYLLPRVSNNGLSVFKFIKDKSLGYIGIHQIGIPFEPKPHPQLIFELNYLAITTYLYRVQRDWQKIIQENLQANTLAANLKSITAYYGQICQLIDLLLRANLIGPQDCKNFAQSIHQEIPLYYLVDFHIKSQTDDKLQLRTFMPIDNPRLTSIFIPIQ